MNNVKYKIGGMECTFKNKIVLEKHSNGRELIALIGENGDIEKFLVVNPTVSNFGFAFKYLEEAEEAFVAQDSEMYVSVEEEDSITLGDIEITYTYSNKKELKEKLTQLIDEMYYSLKWLNYECVGNDGFSDKDIVEELENRLSSRFKIECSEENEEEGEEENE